MKRLKEIKPHKKAAWRKAARFLYTPHFLMNTETVALLRAAAIQALQNQNDDSAFELVSLIDTKGTAAKALPAAPQGGVPNMPAHDYSYWMQLIRQHFIPFITGNGRLRFTSTELYSWLEHSSEVVLSRGDLDHHKGGRSVWKHAVSSALGHLKSQGVLHGESFSKVYTVMPPQLPSAEEEEALFEPFGIQ